jgi:hypothetical protein
MPQRYGVSASDLLASSVRRLMPSLA